jgi:hypothetical protein
MSRGVHPFNTGSASRDVDRTVAMRKTTMRQSATSGDGSLARRDVSENADPEAHNSADDAAD